MPRVKGDKTRKSPTMLDSLFERVNRLHGRHKGDAWPNPKYMADPAGFVREVLKETPEPHQVALLESIRDNQKTAVKSGQKTGKTKTLVWAALWWYCTRPKGKVVMTAAIADQIRKVIWNELESTLHAAAKVGFEIEKPSASPAVGLKHPDGRIIYGFTSRSIEAVGGISSPATLFLVDEASALEQEFAEAIEGNMAGGECRLFYISNPTRTEGPFYDACNSQSRFWKVFHLSSEAVARSCETRGVRIKGMANADTIRGWEEQYGRDSPFFIMRVLGDFVSKESGRVISVGDIVSAQMRETTPRGPLRIGVDPAGPGDAGDEWGFAVVRGDVCLKVYRRRGLTVDAGIAEIEGLLREFRQGDEHPQVNIDAEGSIGAELDGRLKALSAHLAIHNPRVGFESYGIRSGKPAAREPRLYLLQRDEMWANAANWLRSASIPQDTNLEVELHAPFFVGLTNPKDPGKVTITPKKLLREKLGRSPDTADALILAVWDATPYHIETAIAEGRCKDIVIPEKQSSLPSGWGDDFAGGDIDPYGGSGGGIDPYR